MKYISNHKEESQLAKPRYAHNGQKRVSIRKVQKTNHSVDFIGNIVEPMLPIDLIQLKAPTRLYTAPEFTMREPLTTKPSTAIPAAQHSSRIKKQFDMNREILRRLGLLSTQAKREMDIERLKRRALKIRTETDAIPEFNKKTLQIVAKQIKLSELQALQPHRCTTTPTAAARMALEYQEEHLKEFMSQRKTRPQTREAQSQIKDFYSQVAQLQLANKETIREEGFRVGVHMESVKEELMRCKRQLLD